MDVNKWRYFIEIFFSKHRNVHEKLRTREKPVSSALLARKEIVEKDLFSKWSIYVQIKTYVSWRADIYLFECYRFLVHFAVSQSSIVIIPLWFNDILDFLRLQFCRRRRLEWTFTKFLHAIYRFLSICIFPRETARLTTMIQRQKKNREYK